jgi:PAS domain S-box-containing protein
MAASTALGSVFDVASFINEYYDAWSGTDEARIMSYYADDVALHIPGTLMEGKEAVRDQFVRPFITAFPGNRHVVKNMIVGPGVVVVEFSFEAQHKGPFGGHVATGARVKLPGCGVYQHDLAKRQITAGRIYFDVGTLLHTITDSLVDDRARPEEPLQSHDVIPTFIHGIHVLRTDGSVLYVNQAVLDYTGLTLEDVRRKDYRDRYFHPEDVARLREERRQALTRAEPFEHEQRVLGKDGRYRWFLTRYNPLLDEQRHIDRWYVSSLDIEDRKRAEAQVEQAYLRLAEAQRLSKTGSFITDLVDDHNWSEETLRIFEFEPTTKVTLQMIRDMVHPEDLPSFDAVIGRGMTGSDVDFVFRIVTPRGAVKHLRGMARVTEQAGRPLLIGALQDLTESKIAEEALNRARSELAHMARVTTLSALTASIAHEINQPIAAVITSADACLRWLNRDQPEVQRAREAVRRIQEDGKRAAEIIIHLKSFYKKDVSPQRELVSVNDVVGEMLVLLRSEADRHSVVMRTELAAALPWVSADRVQLQQVLMNLMLNGMEAMGEGGGELKISTRREGGAVIVSVRDAGVGIPPDRMDQIFNAFVTTKAGGTGMGLAISRTIIESHAGRLWATAHPGRGATFHFALPTEPESHS